MGKGENAGYQHFVLFPLFSKAFFVLVVKIWHCFEELTLRYSTQDLRIAKIESILRRQVVCGYHDVICQLTLSQTSPGFLRVCSISLLKTLWEKEKLLIMRNFSFTHSVFYPFGELPTFFIKFKIVVCKI